MAKNCKVLEDFKIGNNLQKKGVVKSFSDELAKKHADKLEEVIVTKAKLKKPQENK